MQREVIFSGQFVIDDKVEAQLVKVYLAGSEGVFTAETGSVMLRRKRLYLNPFSKNVLLRYAKHHLLHGTELSMSGTEVGALVDGPLGHPGDGENSYHPVKNVRVLAEYSHSGLRCMIEGKTALPAKRLDLSSIQMPASFSLSFEVPFGDYQALFGLNAETLQTFKVAYADTFNAA